MTSLVCWLGVDSRGPASVYLASDSRISWNQVAGVKTWDGGRKLFASRTSPEILGYVGQVLFPSQALAQVLGLVDAGILFTPESEPEQKREAVFGKVRELFASFPVDRERTFTVVYCTRRSSGMPATFHMSTLAWKNSAWTEEGLAVPALSGIVGAWGSGESDVSRWYERWLRTRQGGRTSRSVFSAFCDALASGDDPFTGGAPQLVGLYRQGAAQTLGVVYQGSRYLYGVSVLHQSTVTPLQWRNALFERCDGTSGLRLPQAQRHHRPRGMGRGL